MPHSQQAYILGRASAALAIFAALLGSTAPSPLYPVYIAQMHLSHAMGTAVFAIYAIGTLCSLALTARIGSKFQDLRKLILPGLLVTGVGAIMFATANGLTALLIGRFFNGLGTGIVTGMASVALYSLSPLNQKGLAATMATLAFTGGAAGGPLLSSASLAVGVAPTLVPFLVIVAIAAIAGLGLLVCAWPKSVARSSTSEGKAVDGGESEEKTNDILFLLACTGVAVAWLSGSNLMAIGADIGLQIFGLSSGSLAGLIPALFQLFGGVGQAVCGRVNPIRSIALGLCGMAFVQLAMDLTALSSFGLLVLVIMAGYGFAYGAVFVGSLGLASQSVAPSQREKMISRFYIVGYLSNAIPSLMMGVLVDQAGLKTAFWIFSAIFVFLALAGAIFAAALLRKAPLR